MKKRIVRHWGKPAVEVKGSAASSLGAVLLLVVWVLAVGVGLFMPSPDGWFVIILATGVLGVPAFFMSRRGQRHRYVIKAMVEARTVPGGAHVVVLDDRGERHELVLREDVARGLALTLEDLAPRPSVAP